MVDQKDSGRIINSVLVLLSSAAKKVDSTILVGSTAKFKKDEGWILPGIGRHVVQIKQMSFLAVRKKDESLNLLSLNHDNSVKSTTPLDDLDLV
jgi:hypothetical protein